MASLSAFGERAKFRSRTLLVCSVIFAGRLTAQGPAAPAGRGSIEGTVINEVTREPVRGAQIVVGSETVVPAAVTDANGRFTFRNLPPGTYFLQAHHPEISIDHHRPGRQPSAGCHGDSG